MGKVVGIDLGTTNSVVAVMEGGRPKVIPSSEGENIIPSVVDPMKRIVGRVAKRQMVLNPRSTIFSVKRLIGHRFSDETVQRDIKWLPYTVKAGENGMAVVEVDGKPFTPQEISAQILQKIKTDAESYLGEKITEAVITVPAYFDDSQRQATKQAGEIAGLEVKRIINEPTAAALAYGLDKENVHTIAVYDLGGGTFDISVLDVGDGVFEVKSTAGDTHLGGDDFDQTVLHYLVDEFKKEQGIDMSTDKQAMQRLRDSAEKAKIELSTLQETEINIPYITADSSGPKHLLIKLSRSKLEQITASLIEKTFESVKNALKDANVTPTDIGAVVLVGGQTRMPAVMEAVKKFFGKEPHKGINPDEVVAIGAAIQAGVLSGEVKDVVLLDVTPLTLGIETLGAVSTPLISRNTTIPTSKSEVFSTAADNQTAVEVHVLQGERPMAADNKSLGRFILDGIPPAPRGVPQVEVTFDIDANGILNVTAKDKASSKEQKITITGSSGLSKEEIERMTKEAEIHASEDAQKKEQVEARNLAENLLFSAEKALKDAPQTLPAEIRSSVEEKIKALRDILVSGSSEDIRAKMNDLSSAMSQIGSAANQTPPPSGESTPPSQDEGSSGEGEVVS